MLVRMAAIKKSTDKKRLERVWRRLKSPTQLMGIQTSLATLRKSMEIS